MASPLPNAPRPSRASRRRLIVLVLLGIVLAGAAVTYRHYWLARPIGSGPAGRAVGREAFQSPWTTRKVVLLGIGDSVTAGFGASEKHSYFDRLAANPADEFPEMKGICLSAVVPNLETRNLAISGSTSLVHEDIIDQLEPFDADTFGLIVITTGGNDIIHSYGRMPPREGAMYGATLSQAAPWAKSFGKRLDAMIDRLEQAFPGGCLIFMADIYDPTDGLGDAQNAGLPAWKEGVVVHDLYNATLRECASRHAAVRLVPMHEVFLGHGIHCLQFWREHYCARDPHYWYADNLEDPNDRGYDAIRREFLLAISRASQEIAGAPVPANP